MANLLPFPEETPLAMQIKSLGDEELLDFWEETQVLERFLKEGTSIQEHNSLQYEKLILQELQLRSCRRCAATAQL